MPTPVVTIIIVSYRSRGSIHHALDALQSCVKSELAECIVVDNASDDDTASFVEKGWPWVTLIRSAENLGFGRGNNLGFSRCRTPYVMILNPDAVIEESAIKTLLAFMEARPKAGIVAPAIVENNQSLQAAGLLTTPRALLAAATGISDAYPARRIIEPHTCPFRTSWVCGAIMLIRSELFRSLGGFDPRFFLYFEETDLCRRVAASGHEIWANGEAVATHVGGVSAQSTGLAMAGWCVSKYYYRSRRAYLAKHFGTGIAGATEALLLLISGAKRVKRLIRPRTLDSSSTAAPTRLATDQHET